jgi:hypothetical protein
MLPAGIAHAAVTISSATTKNMSCVSGVCTPTAKNAVLNVNDLTTMLASGNVTVNTGTGSLAQHVQNIVVSTAFNWASASSLTFDAYDSVTINQPVAVNGIGGVSLITNDGGSGGNLAFGSKGRLSFLGTANALTINSKAFTLENSVASLASAIAGNPSGNYALANNYDASVDGTYSQSPVTTTLTGTVQGLGNIISNLSIDYSIGAIGIGLFANVSSTGAIENMRLTKIAYVNTNHKAGGGVGGLVLENAGYMFGDEVSGSIKATGYKNGAKGGGGGLVDNNQATGVIVSSSANVRITASAFGGGLAMFNEGTITLAHAEGDVIGTSGGLVAENTGTISQSYATGAAVIGGLIGEQGSGTVSDSYSTGSVTAVGGGGGLVGTMSAGLNAAISTSYSTGTVQSGDGGFVCAWYNTNVATNNYWDTTTSGTTNGACGGNVAGITGLTTAQLQSGLPTGFDSTIWAESPKINGGFPYLINNPPPKK